MPILAISQACMRAVFLLVMLLAGAAHAQTNRDQAKPGTAGLETILNPDGTVRPHAYGTFSAAGYTLATGPNGQPVFRPVAPSAVLQSLGTGDTGWAVIFSYLFFGYGPA